ncbi:hypothetical protein [Nocardioides jiangxiensis]|uniref:Uncharacterized protein n=1 Tax=Nocardioides jiangxiensis TaxID=3064524 RepID=A0ABT9B559_9ACTN|nr:hypothetical protein [Nocardioides sp. WY-20]MDO7869444.1 hypothetical protein [Nocardioides sp. WY-20]
MRGVVGLVVLAWLVIGVVAAWQRGYLTNERDVNCRTTADTALTVLAGPLNYLGANPKVHCRMPQPSK